MKTVTIYEVTCTKSIQMGNQGTGYSFRPWGEDTAYIQGYDDGGKEYILPDNLEFAECVDKSMQVYENNQHCPLTVQFGKPALITSTGIVILKRANANTEVL